MAKIFALYKGDIFKGSGTAAQLAKMHGVKVSTLLSYATPRYQKRNKGGNCLCLIRLDD